MRLCAFVAIALGRGGGARHTSLTTRWGGGESRTSLTCQAAERVALPSHNVRFGRRGCAPESLEWMRLRLQGGASPVAELGRSGRAWSNGVSAPSAPRTSCWWRRIPGPHRWRGLLLLRGLVLLISEGDDDFLLHQGATRA